MPISTDKDVTRKLTWGRFCQTSLGRLEVNPWSLNMICIVLFSLTSVVKKRGSKCWRGPCQRGRSPEPRGRYLFPCRWCTESVLPSTQSSFVTVKETDYLTSSLLSVTLNNSDVYSICFIMIFTLSAFTI